MLLLLFYKLGLAQKTDSLSTLPDSVETLRRQTLDRLLDLSDEQSGNSEILEQFNLLRLQKININTSGFAKLLSIPFLTAPDVERILKYRKEKNGFKSVAELRALIDEDTYDLIEDFLTVGRIKTQDLAKPSFLDDLERGVLWQRASLEYIGRTLVETPLRAGFQNGAYQALRRASIIAFKVFCPTISSSLHLPKKTSVKSLSLISHRQRCTHAIFTTLNLS